MCSSTGSDPDGVRLEVELVEEALVALRAVLADRRDDVEPARELAGAMDDARERADHQVVEPRLLERP